MVLSMTMQEDGGRKTQQRDNPSVKTGRSDELEISELKQAQGKKQQHSGDI